MVSIHHVDNRGHDTYNPPKCHLFQVFFFIHLTFPIRFSVRSFPKMKVSKAVSNPLGSAWFVVLVASTHNTLFELIHIFSFAEKVSLALSK